MPFLTDGADDDDEVLMVIASSLGKLIPHVGGPTYAHTILPPLELLLTVGTYHNAFLLQIFNLIE